MKEVKLPDFDGDFDEAQDAEAEFTGPCGFADWKESPEGVLAEVDRMLEAHGLEVTIYDNGSDTAQFAIKKREV